MKQRISILGIFAALLLLIASCSRHEEQPDDFQGQIRSNVQTEKEANLILVDYLRVEDKVIRLDITQKEAAQLGISKEFYDKAVENVRQTNKTIQELLEKDIPIEVNPPKQQHTSETTRATSLPSGSFSVSGNGPDDEVSHTFWAPLEMFGVNFYCRANAALSCVYWCKTSSMGQITTNYGIGYPWEVTHVPVGLAASNIHVSVFFSASDPNGASASYAGF